MAQADTFNIKSQNLADALKEFALQSDSEILLSPELVQGMKAPSIVGEYSKQAALKKLIGKHNLAIERVGDGTYVVKPGSDSKADPSKAKQETNNSPTSSSNPPVSNQVEQVSETTKEAGEELVIVGTHIRGVENTASPVFVYNRDQLASRGFTTTSEFLESLPQNHGNGLSGIGSITGTNRANLRGLGQDNTLVLVNGRRVAAQSGSGVDLSSIPISAIERIEVLADGASAQYGSESVGGVINIVLRDIFVGGETLARYGAPTRGGFSQSGFVQTLGTGWGSGQIFGSFNIEHNSTLHGSERTITRGNSRINDLQSESTTRSLLFRVEQELGESTDFFVDALGNEREVNFNTFSSHGNSDVQQVNYLAGIDQELSNSWQLNAAVGYTEFDTLSTRISNFSGAESTGFSNYRTLTLDVKADGNVFAAAGGDAKLAIGGQYRDEELATSSLQTNLTRDISALFGELYVPIVSDTRIAKSIEVTAALRYDDYSDFGSFVSPKLGVVWAVNEELTFKATVGEATRAPRLTELTPAFFPVTVRSVIDPQSANPNGLAFAITRLGPIDGLAEETTNTFTAGFEWRPKYIEGLSAKVNLFDTDTKNQIGGVSVNLANEGAFSDFIQRRPNPSDVQGEQAFQSLATMLFNLPGAFNSTPLQNADNVDLILDGRIQNLARVRNRGVDLELGYDWESLVGDFRVMFNATYLIDNNTQAFANADVVDEINSLGRPTDLRLNTQLSWHSGPWSVDTTFYHIDDYSVSATDTTHVPSSNTMDLVTRYAFTEDWPPFLANSNVSLIIRNMFDRDPPTFLNRFGTLSFTDSVGGSLEGRLITLQLIKSW
ncbi:TonB-dependent receptor domain-containing protein [Porticoccus sp. GXU_MW_L64]